MPYADLDLEAGRRNGTVWVNLPNRNFDPEKGHQLYNRYLDELEYGEDGERRPHLFPGTYLEYVRKTGQEAPGVHT